MKQIHPNQEDYELIYGLIPNNEKDICKYILNNYDIDKKKVDKMKSNINNINYKEKEFTIFLIPKGTPRPRSSNNHFYVSGAKKLKKVFSKYLQEENLICTGVILDLEIYLPTPINSMSNEEIYLCEKKLIRPLIMPDFDNLAKTYTDALQSVLILNDNIIYSANIEKYYSIKPRIKIKIQYQEDFDCEYNKNKTINSISYKKSKH